MVSDSNINLSATHFRQVMEITDTTITEQKSGHVRCYGLMAGDVFGFGRHLRLRKILQRLNNPK